MGIRKCSIAACTIVVCVRSLGRPLSQSSHIILTETYGTGIFIVMCSTRKYFNEYSQSLYFAAAVRGTGPIVFLRAEYHWPKLSCIQWGKEIMNKETNKSTIWHHAMISTWGIVQQDQRLESHVEGDSTWAGGYFAESGGLATGG